MTLLICTVKDKAGSAASAVKDKLAGILGMAGKGKSKLPLEYNLQYIASKDGSSSNDMLNLSITKRRTGENRYEHVKLHEVNELSKESHGVFYGDSVNIN